MRLEFKKLTALVCVWLMAVTIAAYGKMEESVRKAAERGHAASQNQLGEMYA